jgi:hypothetical protein
MTETQAARKPIIATATYQEWNQHDVAEDLKTVEFDATRIVAGLSEDERTRLIHDDFDVEDSIFREAEARGLIPAHDGPFSLSIYGLADMLDEDPEYFSRPFPEGREVRHEDTILETPLSPYEQGFRGDEDGSVSGLVVVAMSDLHDRDFEGHLDNVSTLLTGSELLMEIDSSAKAVTAEGDVVMMITGTVALEGFSSDELEEYEAGLADGAAARATTEASAE